jgi:hypothetical protein
VVCPRASPCRACRALPESRGQAHPGDNPLLLDPTPHAVVDAILPEPGVNVNARLVSHAHESDELATPSTDRRHRPADVFEHQQLAAGTQDAEGFGGGKAGVGDREEAQRAGDGVEAVVRELEVLGVAESEIGLPGEVLNAALADRQHRGAEHDARELYVVG